MNRRTIHARIWPQPTPEFAALARKLAPDATLLLIGYLWAGIDQLANELATAGALPTGSEEDLERALNAALEFHVRDAMPPMSPFAVQHAAREFATKQPPPAQSPEYDLAFFPRANRSVMWPVEAKVLRSDGRLAEYIREIKSNFMTGRYAPHSAEAAMVAYLLKGHPDRFFKNLAKKMPCVLHPYPALGGRPHRLSEHRRKGKPKPSSRRISLHHLVAVLS